MPSRNTIEIVINATDNASGVFNKIGDSTQTIGKTIGTALVGGLAVASVAIAGFAAKGISEFTTFQQGMQEVFSLMPGMSQDAMDKMSDQVKVLSERFGVLPEKTIPAFYEALSAGIPADNVFAFVETANKAAIAGVTDLDTAVSGISSVINAYGAEIIDATKASDIMFTAVKLGKTTFEELSRSLYNVTPTASALGVTFEDVSAQLAAITAVGVPTSVATTQMRQLFIELSKAGGKASDTFKELSGKTFKDFIAEGYSTQDALKLLEKHASSTGVGINDLFSSVEAGAAALALTGQNSDRYTDFLSQMQTAAGSTQTAFETMSDTIQFQANRLQAKLSVFFINLGSKFAPLVKQAFEDVGDVVSAFTLLLDDSFDASSVTDFLGEINPALRPFVKLIFDVGFELKRVTNIISRFFKGVAGGVPFLDNLKAVMYSLFPKSTADAINVIINGLNSLWMAVKPIIDGIIKWVSENVELKDVLIAIGIAISSVLIPAIVALATPIAIFGAMIGAVTLLRKAWETDFLGIQTFVIEKLIPALQMLADWFINDALPKVIDFVQNVAIPALQMFVNWLSGIWESVRPHLENLANWFINDALPAIVSFISNVVIPGIANFIGLLIGIWNTVKPHLENLYKWFVTEALPAIVNFIQTTVIPGVQKFIDLLAGIWNTVSPILSQIFDWFVTTAMPAIVNFINNTVIPAVQGFIDILIGIWNTVSPILGDLLNWFITEGLPLAVNFINNTVIPAIQGIIDILKGIWESVQPGLNALKEGMNTIFTWIKTNIIDPIAQRIQEFIQTLQNLGLIAGNTQSTINNAVANAATNPSRAVTNPSDLFGYANGLTYAPRRMPIIIHPGEGVLTKEQNQDYLSGQNQNNKPSVVIENVNIGSIQNQNDANDKARMFVNGLRAQGIEI